MSRWEYVGVSFAWDEMARDWDVAKLDGGRADLDLSSTSWPHWVDALNELGGRGWRVQHIRTDDPDGHPFVVLGRQRQRRIARAGRR